jgi:HSP20 family protein
MRGGEVFLKSFNLFKRGRAERRDAAASAASTFQIRKDLKLSDLRSWDELAAMTARDFQPPKFSMAQTDEGLEIAIDLPGIDPEDMHLELADGLLTLKAQGKGARNESDKAAQIHRVAQVSQSLEHRIKLPFEADGVGAQATLENGHLKIFVPRSIGTQAGPTKIEVRAG